MACDVECQKEKKLKTLQGAYLAASQKAGVDPEGYEKAKVAYFTLRDGPTWLHNYEEQKSEQAQLQLQRRKKQLEDHTPQEYGPITEDSYEFTKFVQNKQDTSDVQWRLLQLGNGFSFDYIKLALTIILALYCVYQLFIKYPKIVNYFTGNS
jgi:hypothetical protein